MKNTDAKTRAAATTPGAGSLEIGEQLSLELESESQHQTGRKKERMIEEANASSAKPERKNPDTQQN